MKPSATQTCRTRCFLPAVDLTTSTAWLIISWYLVETIACLHKLFLELWAADGRKTNIKGIYNSPLLEGVLIIGDKSIEFKEDRKKFKSDEVRKMLLDYIT